MGEGRGTWEEWGEGRTRGVGEGRGTWEVRGGGRRACGVRGEGNNEGRTAWDVLRTRRGRR